LQKLRRILKKLVSTGEKLSNYSFRYQLLSMDPGFLSKLRLFFTGKFNTIVHGQYNDKDKAIAHAQLGRAQLKPLYVVDLETQERIF